MTAVRFDSKSEAWWMPTPQWIAAWLEGEQVFWLLVLADYRQRVNKHYADQYRDNPKSFPLMSSSRIVIVVSLLRKWVFSEAAAADEVSIMEMWEDPVLADWDILHAPNVPARVRKIAGLPADLEMIDTTDIHQLAAWNRQVPAQSCWDNRRVPALEVLGWDLADRHDNIAGLENDIAKLRGYGIDRQRLRQLTADLATLDAMRDPNARGLKLEPFVQQLLEAHGFEVERGKHRKGEQIDLIVHRPLRALIECRWQAEPVGRAAVTELIGKLTRDRPAIVAGIYISMTGFTDPAKSEAREHARDRVVVLLDRTALVNLLSGEQHGRELIDRRVDEIVRRYER